MLYSAVGTVLLGWAFIFFGRELLAIYNPDPEAIKWGFIRVKMIFSLYIFCGVMDVISGALRGLGHSLKPAIVIVFWVCVFRIIWIFTVFRYDPTMETLFWVYPVSWIMVCLFNGVMLYIVCRKMLVNASKRLFDK